MSQRFQKRDHLEGFALVFLVIIIAIIVIALSNSADAGGFRQAACAPHVVHQQAAVVAAVPYPVVGYQVGQYLQQQAVDEHAFRASPSKERLTFLEGYYQAKQEEIQPAAVPQVDESSTCPDCEKPTEPPAFSAPQSSVGKYIQKIGGYPPPPQPPQRFLESTGEPLAPGQLESFAETHPLLSANCASCHVDEQSKGGFGIVKVVTEAQAAADCETILAMVDSIATGAMPKGKTLSDADRLAAIAELLGK